MVCYNCYEPGHKASECPKPKGMPRQAVNHYAQQGRYAQQPYSVQNRYSQQQMHMQGRYDAPHAQPGYQYAAANLMERALPGHAENIPANYEAEAYVTGVPARGPRHPVAIPQDEISRRRAADAARGTSKGVAANPNRGPVWNAPPLGRAPQAGRPGIQQGMPGIPKRRDRHGALSIAESWRQSNSASTQGSSSCNALLPVKICSI